METSNNLTEVKASQMQITLREAMLEKAQTETKNKFTGMGSDNYSILRDDAECIIATIMAVCKAKRNTTMIQLDDGLYFPKDYPQLGNGLAQIMNWSGEIYNSVIDEEKPERNFVKVDFPDYVCDTDTRTANGKAVAVKANGRVVSPKRLQTLLNDFNGLQSKADSQNTIKVGANVDKKFGLLADFQYLYFDGQMRQVKSEGGEGSFGPHFCTLVKPTIAFPFTFGKPSEEEPAIKVWEWLW